MGTVERTVDLKGRWRYKQKKTEVLRIIVLLINNDKENRNFIPKTKIIEIIMLQKMVLLYCTAIDSNSYSSIYIKNHQEKERATANNQHKSAQISTKQHQTAPTAHQRK